MSTQHSYAISLPAEMPLYESIPDRLRHLSEENPTKDAFIFYTLDLERIALSRQDIYNRSINLAKVLVGQRLKKGQRVGFCMSNSVEMLLVNFAVIAAGGVPFYMATNLRDGSDLAALMNEMEATILIIDANEGDDNWKIIQGSVLGLGGKDSSKVPTINTIICNGKVTKSSVVLELSSLLRDRNEIATLPTVLPEDVAFYLCTSGSTGKPKSASMTHFGILNWTSVTNKALYIRPDSVFFCERPLSWAVGYPRTYLVAGTTRIFADTKLSLSGDHVTNLCDIIKKERCDVVYLPGYLNADLMRNPQLEDRFQNVNVIICAGERIPRKSAALLGKFCKKVSCFYGSTETGGAVVYTGERESDFEDGLIGKPIEGIEVKIIDDGGDVVRNGETGELCVRTPYRFRAYKNNPELYAKVLDQDNWFHTGDIAHIRNDGNFVVDGRGKEWISIQSIKYFPWEVEKVLKQCPGVKYAIAVGVPDARLSNSICACVVLEQGAALTIDDVTRFCDQKFLTEATASGISLKPKHFVILDTLLLTASGKIDRLGIRDRARELIGV